MEDRTYAAAIARAESLANRRQSTTSVFAAVELGALAAEIALVQHLQSSAVSALLVSVLCLAAAALGLLWFHATRWYRRAIDHWFSVLRNAELGVGPADAIFTAEFTLVYSTRRSPTSFDLVVAASFAVCFSIQAAVALAMAVVRA